MSTVLSALVIVCALTASGALLVQLAISESRRSRMRAGAGRSQPVRPPERPVPPERTVPPPPVPVVRVTPVRPVAQATPVQPVVRAATLSPDGVWLWTGSAWVPAWWGGPTVPPPPTFAVAAPRPSRSHGCGTALGLGCATVLGIVALVALGVLAATSGLFRLSG